MIDFEAILDEAHAAARAAVAAKGPENPRALDCGFAWVIIAGNHPLANHCRKMLKSDVAQTDQFRREYRVRYGSKGYPSGWQFWNPGDFAGQAIGHHEAGAKAFRDVLTRHNIRCDVGSRYD